MTAGFARVLGGPALDSWVKTHTEEGSVVRWGVGEGGERRGRQKGATAAQHTVGRPLPLPRHLPKGMMGLGWGGAPSMNTTVIMQKGTRHPHADLPIKYIIYLFSDVSS